MEIYILDSLLRRTEVVDKFESLIWTERYTASGDIEMVVKSTLENRSRFIAGAKLAMNLSRRVMEVETVQDATDADGKAVLTITGYSIERLMSDRVVKLSMADLATEAAWLLYDTPGNVARTMFDHICRDGALDLADKIPFLMPGSIMTASTIPESPNLITWIQEPESLYSAIKKVCDQYDLGFRLIRNFDNSQLYFDVYSGHDRTTKQQVFAPVVFAPDFDNLQNTTELTTVEGSKNVAYVFSEYGSAVVYPEVVAPDVDGFDRRVLMVKADNVSASTPPEDILALLTQKGLEELSKARGYTAFDGELNHNSLYIYGVHYELGDMVEMRNVDGVVNFRRVTEQIFVCDGTGEKSYPTLSSNMFVTPGSWVSWNNDTEWIDFTTEHWADM